MAPFARGTDVHAATTAGPRCARGRSSPPRPLPHSRRAALHRAAPHITGGEYTWKAGLQQEWRPSHRAPPLLVAGTRRQFGPGEHEPLGVELHAAAEPRAVRVGPDEQEQPAGGYALRARSTVPGIAPRRGAPSPRGRSRHTRSGSSRWARLSIRSTRYRDIPVPRSGFRTTTWTGARIWPGARPPAPRSYRRPPRRPPPRGRASGPPSRSPHSRSRRPRTAGSSAMSSRR